MGSDTFWQANSILSKQINYYKKVICLKHLLAFLLYRLKEKATKTEAQKPSGFISWAWEQFAFIKQLFLKKKLLAI